MMHTRLELCERHADLASVSSPEGSEAGNGQALQLVRHTARGLAVQVCQHHQHLLQQELHGSVP